MSISLGTLIRFSFENMAKWTPDLKSNCGIVGKKQHRTRKQWLLYGARLSAIQSMIPLKRDISINPGLYSLEQCSSSGSTWQHFVQNWLPARHGAYQCKPFKGNGSATNSDCLSLQKNWFNHFAMSAVVCLLWDLGEKELSAAESWCPLTEGSAWGVQGRSGSYWQWLKQIKHQIPSLSNTPSHICNTNTSLSNPKRVSEVKCVSWNCNVALLDSSRNERNVRASRMYSSMATKT